MTDEPRPLDRRTFEAQQLMQSHSPIWHHPNKQVVFEIACPPGSGHRGQLEYTRWPAMALPDAVDLAGIADLVESAKTSTTMRHCQDPPTRSNGTSTLRTRICLWPTGRPCWRRTKCKSWSTGP